MAALVPDMFCNFYFVKNHKIARNSATTDVREKISKYLESLELKKKFMFDYYQILLNKINRFLVKAKLFSSWKSLIISEKACVFWGHIFSHVQPFYEQDP